MNTLIVDDKQFAVNALLKIMAAIDPNGVHTGVLSAAAALEFLPEHPVDVAFLDIEMPGMSGLELAKRIKDIYGKANIVFVTGYAEYALCAHSLYPSGYLMKPANEADVRQTLENLRNPVVSAPVHKIRVQCFGNFEVFANGTPLHFRRSKAKDLLAYIIDRMGARCTMGELIGILWEDKPDSLSQRSQLRNLIHDLKKTLAEVGAEDILIRGHNTLAVDRDKLSCDYYDYLGGIPAAVNLYQGEYMSQYSWAEMNATSAEL